MKIEIFEIYKNGITNPSGIVSCLYSRGLTGKFYELRKFVIKEVDRILKNGVNEQLWFNECISILIEKGYNSIAEEEADLKEWVRYFGISMKPIDAVNFYLTTIV